MVKSSAKHDILSIRDVAAVLPKLISRASDLRKRRHTGRLTATRPGRNAGMIFEKPSTRTRTSFEVAMNDLGGHAVYLSPKEMQLGRGETIADTARVLSRYVDTIVYRAFRHEDMEQLARYATVPVINALDDREHPCQILADLLTLHDRWRGRFKGKNMVYVGDGNNVFNSLMLGAAIVGLNLVGAIPRRYRPSDELVRSAIGLAEKTGATFRFEEDPRVAARDADVLYTDVWISMGDEAEKAEREAAFGEYKIDADLVGLAHPAVLVMHDLPAHRGLEITDDVMDGPRSIVWDQAENRLHAQKALLEWVLPTRSGDPKS